MSDDLIVVGREKSPEQLAAIERPTFVVAGTGGARIKFPDGRIVGPIAGEALRHALARGAKVVSEEPVKTVFGKSAQEQKRDAARDAAQQEQDVATMFGR